jgi:hypothetical protein
MPARLTAYLPDTAAASYLLRSQPRVRIGRGADSDFRIDHPSISRRHAELSPEASLWRLDDAGSKNGCFLDGVRTGSALLERATWLRFGDILCEFSPLSDEAAEHAEQRLAIKRNNSLAFAERLAQQTSLSDLLAETLRAAVELADCERGFLLLAEQGQLRVAASHGLELPALRSPGFQGSVGATQRALAARQAVVFNDVRADPELAGRASVIAGDLRTVLCLPLLATGGDDVLGLIYVDSRRVGAVITTMDLDLLRVFAERAALWIAARRGVAALSELLPQNPPAWAEFLDGQLRESA